MVDAAVADLCVCEEFNYLLLSSVTSWGCSKMGLGAPSPSHTSPVGNGCPRAPVGHGA